MKKARDQGAKGSGDQGTSAACGLAGSRSFVAKPQAAGRWAVLAAALAFSVSSAYAGEPTLNDLLHIPSPATQGATQPSTAPAATQPGKQGVPGVPGVPLDKQTIRKLSGKPAGDVFQQAIGEMDRVSVRLARKLDPGLTTQRMQEEILAKLDQVIAAAKRRQLTHPKGNPSGGGNAQQQDTGGSKLAGQNQGASGGAAGGAKSGGAAGSSGGGGSGHSANHGGSNQGGGISSSGIEAPGPDKPIEELRKEWGALPPQLRRQINEGLDERFSPVYRELTQEYYRHLAERGKARQ